MSFWNLSDDTEKLDTSGSFESGGGSFDPIPEGTQVIAMASEAKWDSYEGDEYISLRWDVIDGEHKGRIVFQKIRVKDDDSKKRDKAIRMLAAIDSNAGGALMKLGTEPNDMDLANSLTNKPMALKLGVWEFNDKKGNWVMAVSPTSGVKAPEAAPVTGTNGEKIPF